MTLPLIAATSLTPSADEATACQSALMGLVENHVFPESGGKEKAEPEPAGDDDEISPEAMAMAYLMRGIHF